MRTPAVSVILPFWNAEETLSGAISSIRAQEFENWELVLLDDGSTDGSPAVAKAHASEDRRIRFLQCPHAGIVQALQTACSAARAQYLARMDADDIAHPQRLGLQLAAMNEDRRVGLCGARVRMTGPKLGPGRKRYEAWINRLEDHAAMVRELFVECPLAHPTFFMRRSVFESAGGYQDHGWAEDYDLCMRMWLAGARFAKVDHVLLDWRESPDRLSMRDARYSPARFRDLKRRYLGMSYFRALPERSFYQWGAGEVGKVWLREWTSPRPAGVVDINPRKIGKTVHWIPVIAPEALPPPGTILVVVAVGAPGARTEIRNWLNPRGYKELDDYLFVA